MYDVYVIKESFANEYFNIRALVKPEDKKEAFIFLNDNKKEDEDKPIFSIQGETAVIKIIGVLSQEGPDWIDKWLGYKGTAYKDIIEAANIIKKNESVKNVIIEYDTPGGSVSGISEASKSISELSAVKNTVSINLNTMASGGYWLGSQSKKIYASSPLAETGSIGVVTVILDTQRDVKLDEYGIARVRLVSQNAKNKRPDITKPKELKEIQNLIDGIERTFIAAIAQGRNISNQDIIDNFGQGAMFIARDPSPEAKDAIKIGMIDGIIDYNVSDVEGNVRTIAACIQPPTPPTKPEPENTANNPAGAGKNNNNGGVKMTLEELKAQHPALYQEVFNAGREAQKKESADITAKAGIYIKADSPYPASIKAIALEVIEGKATIESLQTTVKAFDAFKEQQASDAAKTEGGKDVNGGGLNLDVTDPEKEDPNNRIKRLKTSLGQEVK